MSPKFIFYNGDFFPESEKLFGYQFLQKKLVAEEIRTSKSKMPFWNEFVQLILFKLKLYDLDIPFFLEKEGSGLKRQIERTLIKNKLFKDALVTVSLFREQGKTSYLISVSENTQPAFALNKNGLVVDIFDKVSKAISPLSSLSEGSIPFWEIMDKHKKSNIELLLTNTNGSIIEGYKKNIYIIKKDEVLTPAMATGAYVDLSAIAVKKACENIGIRVAEINMLKVSDLLNANELFFCNCINGIEWIKGFQHKRYFCKTIRLINEEFNRLLI